MSRPYRVVMSEKRLGAAPLDYAAGRCAYEAYVRAAWPIERQRQEPAIILPWRDLPGAEKRGWIAAAKASRGS